MSQRIPAESSPISYGGDLSLVLDGTSKFTLSNDILILPREYVASDGAFQTDSSSPGIAFTPTSNDNVNDVSIIGRPFFSAAYIMVDLDAETWTIWQANATTETRLVSVGGDCAEKPKVNTAPPEITPPDVGVTNETSIDNTASSATPASVDRASTSLEAGAIAGIALGAVFGSGLLAGALIICWLRRKRQMRRRSVGSEADIALTKYEYGREFGGSTSTCHEKSADSAQELSCSWVLSHELPVAERPMEVSGGHWSVQAVELPSVHTPKP
jgi:hypothetical protein